MGRAITAAAILWKAASKVRGRKWRFLAFFILVFLLSFATLAYFDLLPEHKPTQAVDPSFGSPLVQGEKVIENIPPEVPEHPVRIVVPAIGLDARVTNPVSVDIAVLDAALLEGAVRYPTSAKLGETGTVVIFGHSSYLPVVSNQNFKAFNDIQHLAEGDRIEVVGRGRRYIYEVTDVRHASAEEDGIPLATSGQVLTLATCDSFGAKTDRFVVTANFVESRALSS